MSARPEPAHVGDRVRTLRVARGWSMRGLAEYLGVSAATVHAIEHGQTGLSLDRLSAIAHAFSVPVTDLLPPAAGQDNGSAGRADRSVSLDDDPALRAAIAAFVEAGYHGSSIRAIAERAGMSLAGIYHYYPSKHSLLVRILDMAMDELERRFSEAESAQADPLDQLYRYVETLALFHAERADVAYIGASEMRSLDEPDRSRIALRRTGIQRRIDHEIRRAVDDGSAHCLRPQETGRAIATMCTSLPQWFDASGPTSPASIARHYARLGLRMIGADHAVPETLTQSQTSTGGPQQ